ncbi:uncharacterized protein LOC143146254 [Ptiloglossa arizonensis]|uniref:uncharacterized protein LOC143146254 n=1 Tax=Ptiloglossa arizonensis TaxID=3350558 RepID=UPI003FA13F64
MHCLSVHITHTSSSQCLPEIVRVWLPWGFLWVNSVLGIFGHGESLTILDSTSRCRRVFGRFSPRKKEVNCPNWGSIQNHRMDYAGVKAANPGVSTPQVGEKPCSIYKTRLWE